MKKKSEVSQVTYTDTKAALLVLPAAAGVSSVVFGEFILQANPEVQAFLQQAVGEYAEMLLRYYLSDVGAMLAIGGLPGSYIGGLVLITSFVAHRNGDSTEAISGHSRREHDYTLWLSISLCSVFAAYEIEKEGQMMHIPSHLITCVEKTSINYCPGTGDYGDMLVFYSFLITSVLYALAFLAKTTKERVKTRMKTS